MLDKILMSVYTHPRLPIQSELETSRKGKVSQIIIIGAVATALCACGALTARQQGCPLPSNHQFECYDAGPPICDKKLVLRDCGPTMGSPMCCNPNATIMPTCCGTQVYNAGVGGPCPDGGNSKCVFGLVVVNPESGRVTRACVGDQFPHLRTAGAAARKGGG